MIQPERLSKLNDAPRRAGRYVLYWMQASQRARWNHALEHAISQANALGCPVVACFGLTAGFPEANARHYTFMIEGLADVRRALARRGIPLIVRRGEPPEVAAALSRHARLVVTDRGYLRIQREWRARAAREIACALEQVESDVVVPVEIAAPREQYSAATLRPRLHRLLPRFLVRVRHLRLRTTPYRGRLESLDLSDVPGLVRALGVDRSVPKVADRTGGPAAAARALRRFLRGGLARYARDRSDPARDGQSGLSPYLHFGHLSPLEIALAARPARGAGRAAFLEELIVRRELSINFTHYSPAYDRFECLPAWCRQTLHAHARDRRPHLYQIEQLEQARTHDPWWNAAQNELVLTGRMHGQLRMYWGKKILEWTERPERAFEIALALNNKYQLDGRDPNSFAGVAWCFGKHDRPWGERPIFGLVRYMNAAGLERKFDMPAYLERIARLEKP